jgi:hypothetical protein
VKAGIQSIKLFLRYAEATKSIFKLTTLDSRFRGNDKASNLEKKA